MKKSIRIMAVTVFAALFLAFASAAVTAATPTLYFSATEAARQTSTTDLNALPADAIAWYKTGSIYYLFLPSSTDAGALRLWFNAEKITIDGKTVGNNTVTDALASKGDHNMTMNGSSYLLRVMQSDHIPAVFLTTSSGTMANIDASADHSFAETGSMLLTEEDGTVVYSGGLSQVKGRGNATWAYPKRPYQIKLDSKTNLFGMGKAKTWLLLANYYDKSLIRNALVLDMADQIGLKDPVQYVYVDVYANHQYLGNYMFCEKVEVGSNRVDIADLEKATEDLNSADLDTYSRGGDINSNAAGTYKYYNIPHNPSDITGGYLLEFDYAGRYLNEASGFVTNHNVPVVIKSPEYASKAQVEYIRSYVQAAEDAMYSVSGYNSAGKHYSEYIDVDSAVLHYLLEEWCKNPDGGFSSFYIYKDSDLSGDSKIHFDQVWDYDTSFGNLTNLNFGMDGADKWWAKSVRWFKALIAHDDFAEQVETAYRDTVLPVSQGITAALPNYKNELMASAAMNFLRWDRNAVVNGDTGSSFSGSIDYLAAFIAAREKLFEEGFSALPFQDVYYSTWYYSEVRFAYQHGIMSGIAGDAFAPDAKLTRAMAVQILANLSGDNLSTYTEMPFSDVSANDWYFHAIAWGAEQGIALGMDGGRFGPNSDVTREQMAAFLYRYAGLWDYEDEGAAASPMGLSGFVDAAAISPYAQEAVAWAIGKGYIKGISATELSPQGNATRAQAAAIFSRYYKDVMSVK
ncbi:MAG TPA: CotH kinase family protein [Clostridiales bacterium]|nr:CotH kinase family protein [Clostridiales bacterium]